MSKRSHKRPRSHKIDGYLEHIENGMIAGKPGTSGVIVLKQLEKALAAILDGTDPDTALGITRTSGPEPKRSLYLAIAIHNSRAKSEKWAVIERYVNAWLAKNGEQPMSPSRIRTFYKERRLDAEREISWQKMLRELQRDMHK